MIRSMTGFGSYEGCDEVCFQYWEIRSVNARGLNIRFKIPSYLRPFESHWIQQIKKRASRGSIDVFLNLKILKRESLPFSINEVLLEFLFDHLKDFASNRGEIFVPDYNKIFSIPGLWVENPLKAEGELFSSLSKGLECALSSWNLFREREGRELQEDLVQRITRLREIRQEIDKLSSSLATKKFDLLKDRIKEILKSFNQIEEERLHQELAILSDRLDISEELVRLDAHLGAIEQKLSQGGDAVGRTLDFLLQECFREINTCANKAQSCEISALAVDFKTELEKCREQVQNLE